MDMWPSWLLTHRRGGKEEEETKMATAGPEGCPEKAGTPTPMEQDNRLCLGTPEDPNCIPELPEGLCDH